MPNSSMASRFALIALGLLMSSAGFAQSNLETNAGIQFNFSVPGAANLGMGGAFLALADDSTAAYTNPAGLVEIPSPEIQVEARGFSFSHVFTDRGRLDPPARMQGLDTIDGLVDGEATNQEAGLSFLSYVHPFERWALSLYRHEIANFKARFETQGAFLEQTRTRSPLGIPGERDGRLASLRNRMDLRIAHIGLAAAVRVSKRFSLGVGCSYYDFSLDTLAERFIPDLFDPPDFNAAPANFQTQKGEEGEENDWGFLAGFLWESSGGDWRLGGVYRQGPEFGVETTSQRSPETKLEFQESFQESAFHVPTVYGIGAAYLPGKAVRLTLDIDRVEYSALTRGFVDIFELENFFDDPDVVPKREDFKVDDGTEVHLGFEYYFLDRRVPFALRWGAWLDPDHRLRYEGDNKSFGAIFREGRDEMHYSFGLGASYRRYQVHFGIDYSKRVSTAALSMIVYL